MNGPDALRNAALSLSAGVHGVRVGDDVVLLDEGADAYYCLPGAGTLVETGPAGLVRSVQAQAAQDLLEAGLVGRPGPQPRVPPPPPRRSFELWGRPARPAGPAMATMIRAGLQTQWRFRTRSFAALLARVRADRVAGSFAASSSSDVLKAACEQYAALRPWAPFGGACLERSHMMLGYLRRLGLDADWVIGVRTWPFAAHCWLQAGDAALDDDHERLAAYTPLMVV